MRKRSLSRFFQITPISAYFNVILLIWGFFITLAKDHISALNVNTSEVIATDLMGISLLKKSLLCVKFYIYKIDSISVFCCEIENNPNLRKGVCWGRVSYDNHSLDKFRI